MFTKYTLKKCSIFYYLCVLFKYIVIIFVLGLSFHVSCSFLSKHSVYCPHVILITEYVEWLSLTFMRIDWQRNVCILLYGWTWKMWEYMKIVDQYFKVQYFENAPGTPCGLATAKEEYICTWIAKHINVISFSLRIKCSQCWRLTLRYSFGKEYLHHSGYDMSIIKNWYLVLWHSS